MGLPNGPLDEFLASGNSQEALDCRITRLIKSQPFVVLCTQGQGQPYGSLVVYVVTEDLIAKLESEGARFAAENLQPYDDRRLADAIQDRNQWLQKWQEVYRDEYIPFGHVVQRLAQYCTESPMPSTFWRMARSLPWTGIRGLLRSVRPSLNLN